MSIATIALNSIPTNRSGDRERGGEIETAVVQSNTSGQQTENDTQTNPENSENKPESSTPSETKTEEVEETKESPKTELETIVVPPMPEPADGTTLRANLTQLDQETYTNQYLPSLKIAYPADWKFTTTTRRSFYPGLLERDIVLVKGATTITYSSKPYRSGECILPEGVKEVNPLLANINGSEIHRYDFPVRRGDYYASGDQLSKFCYYSTAFRLPSTITNPNFAEINKDDVMLDNEEVEFLLTVDVKGAQHVFEADGIVVESLKNLKKFDKEEA